MGRYSLHRIEKLKDFTQYTLFYKQHQSEIAKKKYAKANQHPEVKLLTKMSKETGVAILMRLYD